METLSTIQRAVLPGDWLASIDLKDAYFHVPVATDFHKYLRFCVQNQHLQFICLPFGLSTSPRVFTKVLLAVVAFIRLKGIRLHHYLDDLLLLSQEKDQLLAHRDQVISTLKEFGWLLNLQKSQLEPTQRLVYLGAQFDTVENSISLPLEKIPVVRERILPALSSPRLKASQCLKIIGTMVSTAPMVKWALWHMRPFQKGFLQQWNTEEKDQYIHISSSMRYSLLWWLQRRNLLNCHSLVPVSWTIITTDASNSGWGAHCLTEMTQGRWSFQRHTPVSNILELRAAYQGLRSFQHLLEGKSVMIRMDNTTAVSYVKRQGGTRSLSLCYEN